MSNAGPLGWLLMIALLAGATGGADPLRLRVPVAPAESLAVEITGAGESVVLIPGLFGSSFGFRKLVPLLTAAGYRAIVIEPLATGASSRPPRADYSLAAQAERIARALDALGVVHALVIAHAVGASEAFRLAYRRPDLVRGLIALEGGPTEAAVTPPFRRALRLAPWIKLLGGIKLVRKRTRSVLVSSSGDTTWVTDDVVNAYTVGAARDLDGTLKAYLAMADAREPEKLAPHLAEIRCPVRLVVGGVAHDGDVDADEVRLLRRTVGSFALDSVRGAGHFVFEEQPDAVITALRRLEDSLVPQPAAAQETE